MSAKDRAEEIADCGEATCPAHGYQHRGCIECVLEAIRALAESEREAGRWEGRDSLSRGPFDEPQQMRCKRCGRADGLNCMISDDLWERITRRSDGSGVLCLWCMDTLVADLRLPQSQPVVLHFAGKGLHGASGWLEDERDQARRWSARWKRAAKEQRRLAKIERERGR